MTCCGLANSRYQGTLSRCRGCFRPFRCFGGIICCWCKQFWVDLSLQCSNAMTSQRMGFYLMMTVTTPHIRLQTLFDKHLNDTIFTYRTTTRMQLNTTTTTTTTTTKYSGYFAGHSTRLPPSLESNLTQKIFTIQLTQGSAAPSRYVTTPSLTQIGIQHPLDMSQNTPAFPRLLLHLQVGETLAPL